MESLKQAFQKAVPNADERELLRREYGADAITKLYQGAVDLEDDPATAFAKSLNAQLLIIKSKVREVESAKETTDYQLPKLPGTESAEAKHLRFRALQVLGAEAPFYLCGRPPGAQGLPAALSEAFYGEYFDIVKEGELDEDDYQTARLLVGALSSLPVEEDSLRDMMLGILQDYLSDSGYMRRFKPTGAGQSETDGTLYYAKQVDDLVYLIVALWMECKLGVSSTTQDITAELLNYFHLHAEKQGLRKDFSLPVIGLEVMGDSFRISRISVGGASSGYKVTYEPLSDFLTALDFLQSQGERMTKLASHLKAMKHCVQRSKDLQLEFHFNRQPAKDYTDNFPYSLRDQSRFTFVRALEDQKQVYHINCTKHGEACAKFMQGSYDEGVHNLLAAEGLAPAILEVEMLPGGWCCIFMELLSSENGWHELTHSPIEPALLSPAVEEAIGKMHALHIVHGDLRPCNIFIRQHKGKIEVKLIDLASAAYEKEARYPAFLNPDIQWPVGAQSGKSITKDLDLQTLRKHFWQGL